VLVGCCPCCIFLNIILLYIRFSRGICFNYYIRESMFSIAYGVIYIYMYTYIYIYIYIYTVLHCCYVRCMSTASLL
jgi:hypothetical protein